MVLLKTIFAFILAYFAMGMFSGVIGLLFLPLANLFKRVIVITPVVTFGISCISMVVALMSFIWACKMIDIQPTYLMFLVPYLVMVSNDFKRIDAVKMGKTTTGNTVQGIADTYSPKMHLKIEYSCLIGDLLGVGFSLLSIDRLPLY